MFCCFPHYPVFISSALKFRKYDLLPGKNYHIGRHLAVYVWKLWRLSNKINIRPWTNALSRVSLLMAPNIKPSSEREHTRHVLVFIPKPQGFQLACRQTPKEGFHNRHEYVWLFMTESVHIWPVNWLSREISNLVPWNRHRSVIQFISTRNISDACWDPCAAFSNSSGVIVWRSLQLYESKDSLIAL